MSHSSAIVASSVLVAIYGILQHFILDFLPRPFYMRDYTRSYAFFDNPNFYGFYLELTLLLAMSLYLIADTKKRRIVYGGAACLQFAVMLYTLTRSAWLGALVGTLLLSVYIVWYHPSRIKHWTVLLLSLAVIFIAVNLTENNDYYSRFQTIINESDKALSGDDHAGSSRWYIWKTSLPLLKHNFWFGSGPDTFAFVFPDRPKEKILNFGDPNIKIDKAHNEYLQIGITLGVPSLLAYLYFVFHVLLSGRRRARNASNERTRILQIGLIAAVSGYLVQAFFNISVVSVAPYYWITLGLCCGFASEGRLTNSQSEPESVASRNE